ncbi:MAG: hypothetical protein IPP72_14950 [Chitinophagaceae bacterium]|nr:hypothetical protein [Chitinophagaceae bacterium]
MNIEEQWKNMEGQQDDELSAMLKMPVISNLSSKDPLKKIKSNLLLHSLRGVLIGGSYIFILVSFPLWQIILCLGIVLLFTVWAIIKALQLYKQLSGSNASVNVLQQMEYHYNIINKWMRLQELVGLFIYPVSAAGGFMLGGAMGSGKPIDVIMQKPAMIIAMLVAVAVLVPCCFYLAKWMNRKAFGRYAGLLKQNIEALKKEI